MILYLIAGHGAGDCGAVGNGYQEAERVRALCSEIKRLGGNNVVYLDPNKNWYKSNGISSLNIAKGDCLLECHMDASVPSAKGGHVIIYKDFEPDKYDKALANMLSDMLPGRSQTIVGRKDLANPNRAMKKGINYRLVEFGFITNLNDVNKFNSRLTELATRVLECFGINNVTQQPTPKPSPVKQNPSSYLVRITASVLNVRKGAGVNYPIATTVRKDQVYTIVDEVNGWGKLKSGAGWISLKYTQRI